MLNNDNDSCPICNSNEITNTGNYKSENFLSCKLIVECNSCGMIFANKMPSSEELDIYYSSGSYYEKTSSPYRNNFVEFSAKLANSRLELLNAKIKECGFKNVLDVGAGNAQFGNVLLKSYPNSEYDAVEPDLEISKQWGDWVTDRFESIDNVNDKTYALVILNQVLEHVNNPISFIASICSVINNNGYLYIDVPYKDYLFKPSVEPHLLFWNPKSLTFLIEKVGLKLIFCDTAGMPHEQAKQFFNRRTLVDKILNPWLYANKVNKFMRKVGFTPPFDTFRQFQADNYGGNRQWLRCIAQKIN
jgi:SAM-dependent methyltransferase